MGTHAVHRPGPLHRLPGVRGRLPRVRLAPRQVDDPPRLPRRRAALGRGHARRSACTARTRSRRAPRSARPTPSWSPPTASCSEAAQGALHRLRQLRQRLPVRRAQDRRRRDAAVQVQPLLRPHLVGPGPDVRHRLPDRRHLLRLRSRSWRPTAPAPRRSTCSPSAMPRSAPAAPWSCPPAASTAPGPGRRCDVETAGGPSRRAVDGTRAQLGPDPGRRAGHPARLPAHPGDGVGGLVAGSGRGGGRGVPPPRRAARPPRPRSPTGWRPAQAVAFAYPGEDDRALAIRLPDGRLVGYSSVCTHLACAVLWRAARTTSSSAPATTACSTPHRRGRGRPAAAAAPGGRAARGRPTASGPSAPALDGEPRARRPTGHPTPAPRSCAPARPATLDRAHGEPGPALSPRPARRRPVRQRARRPLPRAARQRRRATRGSPRTGPGPAAGADRDPTGPSMLNAAHRDRGHASSSASCGRSRWPSTPGSSSRRPGRGCCSPSRRLSFAVCPDRLAGRRRVTADPRSVAMARRPRAPDARPRQPTPTGTPSRGSPWPCRPSASRSASGRGTCWARSRPATGSELGLPAGSLRHGRRPRPRRVARSHPPGRPDRPPRRAPRLRRPVARGHRPGAVPGRGPCYPALLLVGRVLLGSAAPRSPSGCRSSTGGSRPSAAASRWASTASATSAPRCPGFVSPAGRRQLGRSWAFLVVVRPPGRRRPGLAGARPRRPPPSPRARAVHDRGSGPPPACGPRP